MYILQSICVSHIYHLRTRMISPKKIKKNKKAKYPYTRGDIASNGGISPLKGNLIIAHTSTNRPGAPKNYSAPKRHRWNASKGKKEFQLRREKPSYFWTITHDHAHATSCSTTAHAPPGHSQPHTPPYRPAGAAAGPPPSYGSTPLAGPHAPHPCRRAKWPRNGN
jgi:hypothetical protein